MANKSKRKRELGPFTRFYIRQFTSLFWMLLVVGIGLSIREITPWLKEAIELPMMALISGLFGIMIPNLSQFGKAGKVITKTENNWVNLIVGAGITLLMLLLFNWFVGRIIN